jgi:hypothetical protein
MSRKHDRAIHQTDDDSSDEESVNTKLFGKIIDEESETCDVEFNLDEQWKNFCISTGTTGASESYTGLSEEEKQKLYSPFLLHAFGTGLLYSKDVGDIYYGEKGLKEKYLSDPRKKGEAKVLIKRNLSKIISLVSEIFFPNLSKDDKVEIIDNITKALTKALPEEELSLKDAIKLSSDELLKNLKDKKIKFPPINKSSLLEWQRQNDSFTNSKGEIVRCKDYGWELFDNGVWVKKRKNGDIEWQLENDGSKTNWKGEKLLSKIECKRHYKLNPKHVKDYSKGREKEVECFAYISLLSPKSQKILELILLANIVPILENAQLIVENSTESSATKSPHKINSPHKWKAEVAITLAKKGFANTGRILKETSKTLFKETIDDPEVLAAYFHDIAVSASKGYHSIDLFKGFIEKIFHNTLMVRKTLPHRFATDTIEDVTDFLAQIRLSNRSKFREVKNIKDSNDRTDFFDKDAFARIKRFWKFNDGVSAEEEQLISSVAFARDAVVIVLEDRAATYEALQKVMKGKIFLEFNKKYPEEKIDDKDIARWIRQKINGKAIDLEDRYSVQMIDSNRINQFITEFSYLLFGCEVARNPASLMCHQMILDLIIDGNLKWEDAIAGKLLMPMAMEKAVLASRAAHQKFSDFMPWPYHYDGDIDSVKMDVLFAAEKTLFERWLAFKKITPIFAKEALLVSSDEWYGIEMKEIIFSRENQNPTQDALQKWFDETSKKHPIIFQKGDYNLLDKLVTKYEFKPSLERLTEISKIVESITKQAKDGEELSETEIKFFQNLYERKISTFKAPKAFMKISNLIEGLEEENEIEDSQPASAMPSGSVGSASHKKLSSKNLSHSRSGSESSDA